jgi:enoyl-[acyl-carrier protein] reductase II
MHRERVPIVIASQGGPRAHLQRFRDIGAKWVHVVSTVDHARKAAAAGVDAVVVVGAEAGGHPPVNEVGVLVAVRRVLKELDVPVIAGGGVADGYGIAALLALGADAVQLGTRFLLTPEASVHPAYKQSLLDLEVDGTLLVGRRSGLPVRMIRNDYAAAVLAAEAQGADAADYEAVLHRSSLRAAALDGDMAWGKVETGQSAGLIDRLVPAAQVVADLVDELRAAQARLAAIAGGDA